MMRVQPPVYSVSSAMMTAWLSNVILFGLILLSSTGSPQEGIYLSLKGTFVVNNSYVNVDDIGEGGDALLCHTNKSDCCYRNRAGEWYYPDETNVGIKGYLPPENLFYRNRGQSVVLLNRCGNPAERGLFRCRVPDANNLLQTIYVNIVDNMLYMGTVTISPSGPITKTPGDIFSLVCSADNYPQPFYGAPLFEWLFGPDNSSLPSGVVVTNNSSNTIYTSTLHFSPLNENNTGIYTCRIGYSAASIIIFVGDPAVRISNVGTRTVGGSYSLMCIVIGIRSDSLLMNYQWTKNNGTTQVEVGNSITLFFSPLKLSDAGQYICQVTIGSQMYGAIEYVNIEIPAPMLTSITSNPASPIRPIGSAVNLTCTVVLSPLVDVPVTMAIHLSYPTGSPLITTTPSVSGSTYTSTAMINSFGKEESGFYTCRASISSNLPFIRDSRPNSVTSKVTVGVYLSLKETVYANNSVIFVNEIGETDDNSIKPSQNDALQCITDKSPCCRFVPNTAGEWYFPNGTVVPAQGVGSTVFYRNRGFDDGTVNLNHINTLPTISVPTGLFCCVLPDMDDNNQRLCADIDIVIVTITPSGNNTAGEDYSLECSINGHSATFRWFDESEIVVTSQGSKIISTSSSSSLLEFSPLQQSHRGTYTCYANISGTIESRSVALSVKVPIIIIQITDGGITPSIGYEYTLMCSISGAENLNATLAYEWRNRDQLLNSNSSSLRFSSLKLSNVGRYTCQVSITSGYLYEVFAATESRNLVIKIPNPLSVSITSNKASPIRPIGSIVTLTCVVELSPSVDVSVIVNTVWTGPAGFMTTNTAQPVMGSNTTHTSTAMVHSFGRDQSGQYICTAHVTSLHNSQYTTDSTTVYGAAQVTIGVYLTLKGRVYANNSVISKAEISETTNSLQCVTDKMPCCQTGPKEGEWYFPNGSIIPEQENHTITSFYVCRGDNGAVNLNYVNRSSISSPSGPFCCEIQDANSLSQTQCAILIPTLLVKIRSNGVILPGQDFSLNCMISRAESLNPILTYQWIKNNVTGRMQVGSNTSTLSFSSLRLSDAGQYSCQITVSSRYLHGVLNVTSAPFDVHIQVPQPIVRLVSDTPNPIRSGSSPILTCAVELSPAVDVPVTVSTVWTRPDGSTLMSAAPSSVMKSFTHYTSETKLNYVESTDSGIYNCTVSVGGKIRASVEKKITIGDDMFQLRLMYTDDCRLWYSNGNSELYKYHIEEELIEAIESWCKCYFPKANLISASFSCASSPNLTTYRNTLIGTHNFNATQLIGFIQDWVTSAPQINIKDYSVWVDSSCPVAIVSLKEPECGEVRQCPCANDPNVVKCMEHLENENFAECVNTCI